MSMDQQEDSWRAFIPPSSGVASLVSAAFCSVCMVLDATAANLRKFPECTKDPDALYHRLCSKSQQRQWASNAFGYLRFSCGRPH